MGVHDLAVDIAASCLSYFRQMEYLLVPGLLFFLIALLRSGGNWSSVKSRIAIPALSVNLTLCLLDSVILAASYAALAVFLSEEVAWLGWTLISWMGINDAPAWFMGFAVLFVGDLLIYFRHRMEHTEFLWPAHLLHHSDEQLSWFSFVRHHPLSRLSSIVVENGILALIGFPAWALVFRNWVTLYYGMVLHANLPWTYGCFGHFLVSPAMHRWHHARKGRGMRSNFASIFAGIDKLFGTFYLPGPCDVELGVDGVESTHLLPQLMYPFRKLVEKMLVIFRFSTRKDG